MGKGEKIRQTHSQSKGKRSERKKISNWFFLLNFPILKPVSMMRSRGAKIERRGRRCQALANKKERIIHGVATRSSQSFLSLPTSPFLLSQFSSFSPFYPLLYRLFLLSKFQFYGVSNFPFTFPPLGSFPSPRAAFARRSLPFWLSFLSLSLLQMIDYLSQESSLSFLFTLSLSLSLLLAFDLALDATPSKWWIQVEQK